MVEWKLVATCWRERPLLWSAVAGLAALHALAAAAPVVANDRPLYLAQAAGTSFPALSALAATDVFLLVLAPWILCAPVWAALPSRWRACTWAVAVALLVAVLAALAGEKPRFVPAGEWKRALGAGALEAERVLFAPIPFGYSETNPSESWRPPTWLAHAERDDAGRSPHRATQAEPGGFEPAHVPVEVRAGEPARNSWRRHPLGTDGQGRDLLARLVWGARSTLAVGLLSAGLALLLGLTVGGFAGWRGGRTDLVLSRVMELWICFPSFFLVLLVMSVADGQRVSPVLTLAGVIGFTGWTGVARLLRAELLRLREADFVLAARALGCSEPRIAIVHALPNALSPLIVSTSFFAGSAMLLESAISFLGAGIREPAPSLGGLVQGGTEHAWMVICPGLALALAVVGWNVLGEELRDLADPRAREVRA